MYMYMSRGSQSTELRKPLAMNAKHSWQIALNVDTSGDDVSIHPKRFCMRCKHSMERSISTVCIKKGVHYKCTMMLFQCMAET